MKRTSSVSFSPLQTHGLGSTPTTVKLSSESASQPSLSLVREDDRRAGWRDVPRRLGVRLRSEPRDVPLTLGVAVCGVRGAAARVAGAADVAVRAAGFLGACARWAEAFGAAVLPARGARTGSFFSFSAGSSSRDCTLEPVRTLLLVVAVLDDTVSEP